MMFRPWFALLLVTLPFWACARSQPVFDPLNPPDSVVKDPPRPEARAAAQSAAVETMVVTPSPESAPAKAPAPTPTPAAVAAAKPAPAVDTGPRVVAYDTLETQVGKRIQIKTNLRTQRQGVLKRFNRAVLVVEDRSRGFAMDVEIPRQTITEVTLLD